MSASAAFDTVAACYDALWTTTPVGRAQRDLVWRAIDPLFRAGDSMLDIGCGTGEDAAHFAARGVTVHATDASPEMVRQAAARGGFTTAVASAERIAATGGTYDGALSNFGALNCVQELAAVAGGLAAVVRPGGHVAICVIGRFCLWETVYFAARLQFGKAFRRRRSLTVAAVNANPFRVYYRSIAELRAAFAPQFRCERWMGIGILVPPSYVALPGRLVRWLGTLDRALARLPMLRGMADHRLLILVRR